MIKTKRVHYFGVVSAAIASLAIAIAQPLNAQQPKLKIGLMLPYSGTFAALGNAITNGFKLAVQEQGGKLGGREVEYFTVDDESNPAKAPENRALRRRPRDGESRSRHEDASRDSECGSGRVDRRAVRS